MARLPLIINGQRLRTLEELHENFNLTELIERYRSGLLRAWLYNWDFKAEQEQVEALSPDLSEQELAEALCCIFKIEGDTKEQALTCLIAERTRKEQERILEAQRIQEQKRQEEERIREEETRKKLEAEEQKRQEQQRQFELTQPLNLDEIEFTWHGQYGPPIKKFIPTSNYLLAVIEEGEDKQNILFVSEDGRQWEERGTIPFADCFYLNGNFVRIVAYEAYYSPDLINWYEIDVGYRVRNIIWTGNCYALLGFYYEYVEYVEEGFFSEKKRSPYAKPVIFTSKELGGSWQEEVLQEGIFDKGESVLDFTWFNNKFILSGHMVAGPNASKHNDECFVYSGTKLTKLNRYQLKRDLDVLNICQRGKDLDVRGGGCFATGMGKCFHISYDDYRTNTHMTKDGIHWTSLKYNIYEASFLDAGRFIVAYLVDLKYGSRDVDLGWHVSLDGIRWKKLALPKDYDSCKILAYWKDTLYIKKNEKVVAGIRKYRNPQSIESVSSNASGTR